MALLANKIVCITGSSRGIGRACAVESAKHGATGLILHYLGDQETEAELQSLKSEIHATTHNICRVVGVSGDIANSETSQHVRFLTFTYLSAQVLATSAIDRQSRCRGIRANRYGLVKQKIFS